MPINYYLQPNPITPDPSDQSARVISNLIHDVDSIVKEMLRRGTTITEADIRAVLKVLFEVVTDEVAEGNNVNLPLVNIRPGITGVFSSAADSFDGSRHIKKANLSAGTLLAEKIGFAQVQKILQPIPTPALVQFIDITSKTTNSIVTPGGIGQIVGEELKFDEANNNQGIYFIATNGTATKAVNIATRTEGKLIFNIPASLVPGNYTLEVRKGYGSTNLVVRPGALMDLLQVS